MALIPAFPREAGRESSLQVPTGFATFRWSDPAGCCSELTTIRSFLLIAAPFFQDAVHQIFHVPFGPIRSDLLAQCLAHLLDQVRRSCLFRFFAANESYRVG